MKNMKKKTLAMVVALVMALSVFFGAVAPGTDIFASGKEVKQLKKLQKALKKKKKFTKTYKTEVGGTQSIKWNYYKHSAKITRSGKYIVFSDTIKSYSGKKLSGTYNVNMKMKVGNNKKVKVTIKYKSKRYNNSSSATAAFKPSDYKYGKSVTYKDSKEGNLKGYYDDLLYVTMRSWNNLASKKAGVTMKSIGFKKFKVIKDITED